MYPQHVDQRSGHLDEGSEGFIEVVRQTFTFITALAEGQINVRVIQALARHKHVNTTMRYVDINDVKLHNAVEIVSF
jgi:site-specific recombinase XerD